MGDPDLAVLDYCYLTTTGRSSGRPHTIEIWFALHRDRVYLLAGEGEGSDWVRNLQAHPTVGLRLGDRDMLARAYVVADPEEDALARRLLLEKYAVRYGGDLEEWGGSSLPIGIELPPTPEVSE
ncbi:MAG: nitroreductase family deazaflavin-dependent oxidoreductase [Actinomycetota bacterium]